MNSPADEVDWDLDQALVWIASRQSSDGSWQEYRSARPADTERLNQIERNVLDYLPTPRLVGLAGPYPDTEDAVATRGIDRRRMDGSRFRLIDGKTCLVYGDGEVRLCRFVPSAIVSAFPGWDCVSPPPSETFIPYSFAFRWLAQLLSIRDSLAIDLVDDEAQRLLVEWGRSGSLIWYGASSTGDDPLDDYQVVDEQPWEHLAGLDPAVERRFRTSQLVALSPYAGLASALNVTGLDERHDEDVIDAEGSPVSPPILGSTSFRRRGEKRRNIGAALLAEFGDDLGRQARDWGRAQNAVAAWHRQNPNARLPDEANWRRMIDRMWSS